MGRLADHIICLHGLGRSPADWEPTRDALTAVGTVRCPSLPARPDLALQALDHLIPSGAIVIGHSMGAVLTMRLLTRRPRPLRAVVLTGCFYPPARNGRGIATTIRDYGAHRIAFLRESRGERAQGAGLGTARALGSLIHQAITPGDEESALDRLAGDVLIIHARDDHHVPVDFAIAAARRHPRWGIQLLERGGHHVHVRDPARWSATVTGWLYARAIDRESMP